MSYTKKQLPLVVIFGRTNVGKSTLFNCLIEKRQALISNIEGTTRDSNIGQVNWQEINFQLIDTGGIIDLKYLIGKKHKTDDIEARVQQQARDYIKRADLILFLVDTKTGLLPQDKQMALLLKKILPNTKNVLLVANKTDSPKQRKEIAEFHQLNLGEPIPVSAATGSGTGDLLDIIVKKLKTTTHPSLYSLSSPESFDEVKTREEVENKVSVCIIGKPNVGKSSLINAILGYERIIVSPSPHTTREPQDTLIIYKAQSIRLIDTAGISKRGQQTARRLKNKNTLEKQGIGKSITALKKSDLALFMIDVNLPITHQDAKIVEEIIKRKKSLVVIANKWDLVHEKNTKKYTEYIYSHLPFISWVPIQFTSANTGKKINKILDLVLEINKQRKINLCDSVLNKFLNRIIKIHKPAKGKGTKKPRIYELKQVAADPPKFEIQIGPKDSLHFSYLRFIENRLREKFGFLGTPITIKVTKK